MGNDQSSDQQLPDQSSTSIMGNNQGSDQQPPSQDTTPTSYIFSQFGAPASEVADTLPADLVPCRHSDLMLDDPSVSWPQWDTIFGKDTKLTNTEAGLRSQRVNQNIAEIAAAIRNRYKFASISGKLAIYEPPCWRIMNQEEALSFVAETVDKLFPADAEYLNSRQHKEIVFLLKHDRGTKFLREIPPIDYQYMCCRDYMYDWRAGTCYPHSSSFLRFSYLDFDAESIGSCDGTHWEMFLDNLTDGNDALRQRVLEMIGVILTGYPSKSFFFLEGESGTGKSQLVNFLRDVLGESACVALNDVSQLGQKWTTGSIFGKLLCLCGDMPDAPLDNKTIGTIKQLTGDDLIRGEFKYGDAFMFENTAKLLFVSNYPLQIPNRSREQALLKRLVEIPCLNPVAREDQIPSFHEILSQEAGYIVDLAMEALAELELRNGVFTPLPETFAVVMVQAPDNERSIIEFVRGHCILEEGASCAVTDAFQSFQSYFPEIEMAVGQFSKMLCSIYPQIERRRSKDTRKYYGMRLADTSPS